MAAVLAVAVAALVDAVRGGEAPDPRAEAVSELREAGLRGRLVYSTARCRLRALSLPELERVAAPRGAPVACTFSLSPDGRRAAPGDGSWDASSFEFAQCRGRGLDILARGRPVGVAIAACPPAFRPGGGLTAARGEELLEVARRCPPCERVLLSRDDLLRAAARHPNVPTSLALVMLDIRDVEWLSAERVALLLELRFLGRSEGLATHQVLALYEGKRLLDADAVLFGPQAAGLEASPSRHYLALEPGRIVRANGSELDLPPPLENATEVAWSPGETWTAFAIKGSVLLVRTAELERSDADGTPPSILRLPLTVRDLAWR